MSGSSMDLLCKSWRYRNKNKSGRQRPWWGQRGAELGRRKLIRLGTGQYFFTKKKGKKFDPPRYRTIFFLQRKREKIVAANSLSVDHAWSIISCYSS